MSTARAIGLVVGSPTIGAPSLVSMRSTAMRKARKRFDQHRDNSKRRRIPFVFDFASWIATWVYSGHWHQRGRRRGQYVMARPRDQGPYSVENTVIITNAANVVEKQFGKPLPAETRAKIIATMKGRPSPIKGCRRSPATRRRMREGCKRRGETAWRQNVGRWSRRRAEASP